MNNQQPTASNQQPASKAQQLEALAKRIIADKVCPELAKGATQLVFADGSAEAELVFVGEAPGQQEDLQGKPFVGAAGQFLNEMLAEIGLSREDVYITNIVKYRPPNNRDPLPEEKQAFMPYLLRQLEVIKPKLVVFLGRHAMGAFFPELSISRVHGRTVQKDGQLYLALYHPAAALYNNSMKQTLREDFAKIPKALAAQDAEEIVTKQEPAPKPQDQQPSLFD